MAPRTTRRELLRAGAAAFGTGGVTIGGFSAVVGESSATVGESPATIGGFSSVRGAAGASGPHEDDGSESGDEPECGGVEAREGYLFFPEEYRECDRFQLVTELRVFRASVGRGSAVYLNEPRDFTAYGIRYEETARRAESDASTETSETTLSAETDASTETPETTPSAETEETDADDPPLILAVASPDHEESPSLFDYYLPMVRFRFTESKGRFAFQRDREAPRTPVLRTEFVRVV